MIKLALVSTTPVIIILTYIYYRDKYEKEPFKLLFEGLVAGGVVVLPIIYFEEIMANLGAQLSGLGLAAWTAFMVAALIEEAFKFFAVYVLIWRNYNFNEKFDGIVYAVFVSLGFALVENFSYVFREGNGLHVGIIRAFTAVPAHAIFGVMMGYRLGMARFVPSKRTRYLILAFAYPFVFHGLYDFILMSKMPQLLVLFIPFVIYIIYRGIKRMGEHGAQSMFKTDKG